MYCSLNPPLTFVDQEAGPRAKNNKTETDHSHFKIPTNTNHTMKRNIDQVANAEISEPKRRKTELPNLLTILDEYCEPFSLLALLVSSRYVHSTSDLLTRSKLRKRITEMKNGLSTCAWAASKGYLSILTEATLKYPLEKRKTDASVTRQAALNGHLACLQFAYSKGYNKYDITTLYNAIENGHMDCLMYIQTTGGFGLNDERFATSAAKNGQLKCLEYLHSNGCPIGMSTIEASALQGHLECLKFSCKHAFVRCDQVRANITCQRAAEGGHLDCLKFAYENYVLPFDIFGVKMPELAKKTAEQKGHIDCLNFIQSVLTK